MMEEVREYTAYDAETGNRIKLVLQDLQLRGRISEAGAVLTVCHTFRSGEDKPVEAVYAFMLPRDAALRRFKVVGNDFEATSELMKRESAWRRYEEGVEQGSLSVLTQQYRDGVINLNIGNLRPAETVTVLLEIVAGVDIHDKSFRFRFPFTLAPGYHPRARMDSDGRVGEITLPGDIFGDVILPEWWKDAEGLHTVGFNIEITTGFTIQQVSSPSHRISVDQQGKVAHVGLAVQSDVPNRDLILDVTSDASGPRVLTGLGEDEGRFVAVLPSTMFGESVQLPKRIVFVLDRSGSMDGAPMQQARRALLACLGALSSEDSFGVVAFDDYVEEFQDKLVKATSEYRQAVKSFIEGVDARGGTELLQGLKAAIKMLGKEAGDIMVLTDGEVMGTEDINVNTLDTGVKIHCLGIGAASQDRFLTLLARNTGGISSFVSPREKVDIAALKLFSAIKSPIAEGIYVKLDGLDARIEPQPASTIYADVPLLVYGKTMSGGTGDLIVSWEKGKKLVRVPVNIDETGCFDQLRLIHGSRIITDIDSKITVETNSRQEDRLERLLEKLSQEYGLSSRVMSLVAVVTRKDDVAGKLPKTMVIPVGMPEDISFDSYFPTAMRQPKMSAQPSRGLGAVAKLSSIMYPSKKLEEAEVYVDSSDSTLFELAARIMPDGGMPGQYEEERILHTVLTLLAFMDQPMDIVDAFKLHIDRLIGFLESTKDTLSLEKREAIEGVIGEAKQGNRVEGDWKKLASPIITDSKVSDIHEAWRQIQGSTP